MKPKFRFRIGGDTDISDPIGWKDVVLNLERDLKYHSLVENIDTPYEFYGRTASKDGGYARLNQARDNGPDSQVEFLAQVSFDGGVNYDTFFNGMFDLTTLKEVGIRGRRKFQCTILRDDFWAKFINRKSIPVDVQSTTGIDGETVSVVTPKTLNLPFQEIRLRYEGSQAGSETFALVVAVTPYAILDFNVVDRDEIDTKYQYPALVSASRPLELFALEFAGDYEITAEIHLSTGAGPTAAVNAGVNVYIQINDDAAIAFSRTNVGSPNVRTQFTYSGTHALGKNDFIRMYIFTTFTQTVTWETGFDNFLNIVADTSFPDSSCSAIPIHDTGLSICNRIIGRENTFYSEFFGGTSETARAYSEDGCGLSFLTMLGLHIRGYSLASKPYSQSFDEWWDCWNPIFNLGLGYEYVGTTQVIRVEQKSDFYDNTSQSVILSGVNGIEISYDPDYFLTSIEIGYEKWDVESKSGIDDPQTVHTYATRFKTIGSRETKDMSIMSKAYAASLGIEQTRRNMVDQAKDWTLDNDFMIIQSDLSSSPAEPVLYNSSFITGLENDDTRYNVRLTPASNLNRWKTFLANGFSKYPTDFFKFVRGGGEYWDGL